MAGAEFRGIHARAAGEYTKTAMQYARGWITRPEFEMNFRHHMDSVAFDTFLVGKRIATGNPDAQLTFADELAVQDWLGNQRRYLRGFAIDLTSERYSPDTVQGQQRVQWRAGMYADALEGLANIGFAAGAPDARCVWHLGAAEHCDDCVSEAQKGERKMSALGRYPGDGNTECITNCQCWLEIITPGTRKNIRGAPVVPARHL